MYGVPFTPYELKFMFSCFLILFVFCPLIISVILNIPQLTGEEHYRRALIKRAKAMRKEREKRLERKLAEMRNNYSCRNF